ncbi:Binding-protein-dependent transport system inner membrane component [Acididesulfobacillus acetoxydans]|uniref:Binding-protein-dependent transport system inner membrane component n=2 Tax=Acididesulfobacillus acetoxydans TaxID=1561005 RepID=A0A8S0WPU0_9FIRM|nr:Binding-protein-dependent transport system inner membrane component [Acididesulfobacillus acetoxydans]CEJ08720.1 Glutathione transport system permease protein GsiC [Acididesulfobacillus acetoxydans]
MIITLFFIVLIAFVINFVVPGNPARTIAGPKASPEVIKAIEEKYDLNKPVYVQFEHYFVNLLHGDLGISYRTNETVNSELRTAFPKTMYLGFSVFFLNVLIGVPTGIYAAIKRSKFMDHVILISSLVGTSAPTFWIGYILLFIVGYKLSLLPIGGYGGISHVILPALTVSLASAAGYVRVVRTSMLEVLGTDYVRTAEAKGLSQSTVILKHAFRSSVIPLITYAGMDLGTLMGGLIVTEGIFGWPGIGQMAVTAINYQDMPTIMGVVLVAAVAVVIANFVVDIIYALVDPRISY